VLFDKNPTTEELNSLKGNDVRFAQRQVQQGTTENINEHDDISSTENKNPNEILVVSSTSGPLCRTHVSALEKWIEEKEKVKPITLKYDTFSVLLRLPVELVQKLSNTSVSRTLFLTSLVSVMSTRKRDEEALRASKERQV
jgi:hypothetical protein